MYQLDEGQKGKTWEREREGESKTHDIEEICFSPNIQLKLIFGVKSGSSEIKLSSSALRDKTEGYTIQS